MFDETVEEAPLVKLGDVRLFARDLLTQSLQPSVHHLASRHLPLKALSSPLVQLYGHNGLGGAVEERVVVVGETIHDVLWKVQILGEAL
mgnify:FL=1